MPAPKCRVCEAKDQTIAAQQQTIAALNEMVNLQRAIPAAPAPAPTIYPPTMPLEEYPPLAPVEADPTDIEEIAARLNDDPDLDPEVAERLLTQVQAFNTTVEKA